MKSTAITPGEYINLLPKNLNDLITILKSEGVTIVGEIKTDDYGKFAWILDPDGHKVELLEPIESAFENNK